MLAVLVVFTLALPYINYAVPTGEGYNAADALTKAQAAYETDLKAYQDNVVLRDATQTQINSILQPGL